LRLSRLPRLKRVLRAGRLRGGAVAGRHHCGGWRFHRLRGGRWSVWIDQNWRLTFGWSEEGPDALDVDYEDYH
jgi:hypothetical protein